MEDAILQQIQDRYRIEISGLRLQRQCAENESMLRQAKFDLRTANAAQTLYEGSFQSFCDRLLGRKERKETALRHDVQKAEAALAAVQRQKKVLEEQLSEQKQQGETTPGWNELKEGADAAALREWNRLEALYCIEAVLPLLDENHAALIEQRKEMSGANVGKVYTFSEQAEIYSAPEQIGERCKPYILRLISALAALKIPFVAYTYLQNPTAFVNAVIAKHNRRDRVNEAIDQVEELLRLLPKLEMQLENRSETKG